MAAAIFGIINAELKAGCWWCMLVITDALTEAIQIDNVGSALLGALMISVVSWTARRLLPDAKNRKNA